MAVTWILVIFIAHFKILCPHKRQVIYICNMEHVHYAGLTWCTSRDWTCFLTSAKRLFLTTTSVGVRRGGVGGGGEEQKGVQLLSVWYPCLGCKITRSDTRCWPVLVSGITTSLNIPAISMWFLWKRTAANCFTVIYSSGEETDTSQSPVTPSLPIPHTCSNVLIHLHDSIRLPSSFRTRRWATIHASGKTTTAAGRQWECVPARESLRLTSKWRATLASLRRGEGFQAAAMIMAIQLPRSLHCSCQEHSTAAAHTSQKGDVLATYIINVC